MSAKSDDELVDLKRRVAELEAGRPPQPPAKRMVPQYPGGPLVEATGPTMRPEPPIGKATPEMVQAVQGIDFAGEARAHAATCGDGDWSGGHLRSQDRTPSGASVGRAGGPRGPELTARDIADRRINDGIVDTFDGQ